MTAQELIQQVQELVRRSGKHSSEIEVNRLMTAEYGTIEIEKITFKGNVILID